MNQHHGNCQQCGELLEKDERFCANCGTPLDKTTSSIQWDFDIPLLDPFILQGVAKALGIPSFFLFCFFAYSVLNSNTTFEKFMEFNGTGLYFTAILLGITILLTVLFLAIVYKGKYCAQFTVDEQGVTYETRTDQRRVNSRINFLLIFVGLLSGKPGYAGTGLLAHSSQSGAAQWNDVHRITPYPKKNIIVLHDSWHKLLILYCMPANYEAVLRIAQEKVAQAGELRQQEEFGKKKTPFSFKWLWKLLAGLLILATLVFMGVEAYDYFKPSKKSNSYDTTMEDYLKSSAELNKSLETSILKTGNLENTKGNYDKAIENANSVIEINPKSINAYFTRGNGYYGKKDYEKALADYTTILKLSPANAAAHYNRGLTYQALGNKEKAKEDYQQAAEKGHEKAKIQLDTL